MKPIRTLALAGLLVAFPCALAADKAPAQKFDSSKLHGRYTIVKGEKDGKPVPKDHFEGAVVVFTDKKVYGHDKQKKEFFGATYTIDSSRKPWSIEMTSTSPKEGQKASGIIEVRGDTVRICYALPGGMTPTRFSTGEKQHCFELKRVKHGEKKTAR
jgi:uncharacterized protein (TIGR03067 family)